VQTAALTPAQSSQAYQPSPVAGPKIVLNILNDVWIEIRDARGRPLLSRILKPGEQYVVPPGQGLVMDTGNAGAMDVYLGGKKLPRLGAFGNVKRNISLAPESLLAVRAPVPAPAARQQPKPAQAEPQHNTIEPFAQPAPRKRGFYRD
jgi:cytoskeleton protein RodZ